jgi:protein-disulfide isomerase
MKTKRVVFVLLAVLGVFLGTICYFIFFQERQATIDYRLIIAEDDIVIGSLSANHSLFIFYSYNCEHCQRFFFDSASILNDSLLQSMDLNIVLKPLAMSQTKKEYFALQTLSCLYKYGSPEKVHQLLLHNYSIIYRNEFSELTDIYIQSNPDMAECLLNNNEYSYLKKNWLEFRILKLEATPAFVINQHVYKGYKNHQTLLHLLRKEIK